MIWPERIHPNGFHSHRHDAEQPEARFNQRPTAMAASTSTSTPTSISVTQSSLMELSKNLTMRDKTAKIIRFLSPLSPFLLLSTSLYPQSWACLASQFNYVSLSFFSLSVSLLSLPVSLVSLFLLSFSLSLPLPYPHTNNSLFLFISLSFSHLNLPFLPLYHPLFIFHGVDMCRWEIDGTVSVY